MTLVERSSNGRRIVVVTNAEQVPVPSHDRHSGAPRIVAAATFSNCTAGEVVSMDPSAVDVAGGLVAVGLVWSRNEGSNDWGVVRTLPPPAHASSPRLSARDVLGL